MSSLPESLRKIVDEVARFYDGPRSGETPPYIVYVYRPEQEFHVRRELINVKATLEGKQISCVSLSLAEIFWQALQDSGYMQQVFQEEENASTDPDTLERVNTAIYQILTATPRSLPDRVIEALKEFQNHPVAFLYRAGALYPTYRTSALLDDLRERLLIPVVLLYPGRVEGTFGLSFMGKWQPAQGYRAKIVAREDV